MPIDFPNTPSVNQTFTSGARTWTYDGTSWNLTTYGVGGFITCTSTTRPSSPPTGQAVFETDTFTVRTWTGSAWVGIVPSGSLQTFAGATAPAGWLLCFGQEVSRTTYADLYAALSTTHGAGDGSTTFNLPDLRGRVPAGKDNMGGTSANRLITNVAGGTLGANGGAESHQLTTAQLASHTHTQSSHTHSGAGTGGQIVQNGSGGSAANITTGGGGYTILGLTSATPAIQSAGSNASHNNTQPTIILNYIIKV